LVSEPLFPFQLQWRRTLVHRFVVEHIFPAAERAVKAFSGNDMMDYALIYRQIVQHQPILPQLLAPQR